MGYCKHDGELHLRKKTSFGSIWIVKLMGHGVMQVARHRTRASLKPIVASVGLLERTDFLIQNGWIKHLTICSRFNSMRSVREHFIMEENTDE